MLRRRDFLLAAGAASAMALAGRAEAQAPARELLVRNAHVLTMDAALGDLRGVDIHVRDGAVVAIGPGIVAPGAEVIDAARMIALPGFVDTHWHMWNSLLRGLVGGVGTEGYFPTVQKYGPLYTPDDTYQATRFALADALNAGVTTVHNWAHNIRNPEHALASLRAHDESGLRARFGYGSPQLHPNDRLQDLEHLAALKRERFSGPPGHVRLGAALRGPQFSAMETVRKEWGAVRAMGLPISTHVTGNAQATARFKTIATLNAEGFLGPDVQLIHAVHATKEDIDILAQTGTHLSVSPTAEMPNMGIIPLTLMLQAGVRLSLSIDNTALPQSCDMFSLMRTLVLVTQGITAAQTPFNPRKALELATVNGARDLGFDDVGTLAPGKRADLILVRMDDLNMAMSSDRNLDRMLMTAQPANVDTVIVDGRIMKRGGRLVSIDAREVVEAVGRAAAGLRARGA